MGSDWEYGDGQARPCMGWCMGGAWHGSWVFGGGDVGMICGGGGIMIKYIFLKLIV